MKNETRTKRLAATLLAALFAALLFLPAISLPVRAEAEEVPNAFTKPSQEIDAELLYKESLVLDDFDGVESWKGGTTVKTVSSSTYAGGTKCLLATADGDRRRSLTVSRSFTSGEDGAIETAGYRELSFSFLVLGATEISYSLTVTVVSGGASVQYAANVASNDWQTVFLDLAPIGGGDIESLKFTVTGYATEAYVGSAALSSLVLGDTSHGDLAEKYSALYIYGASMTDGGIVVTPEGSSAVVRADALLADDGDSLRSTVMVAVTLGGVRHARMAVSTSTSPAWMESMFTEMTSLTVTSETETYVCCFAAGGTIASWSLEFSNLNIGDAESFLITGVSVILGGDTAAEALDVDPSLGKIARCAYSGVDNIQISGSLAHDAAVEYIDGDIALYAVPGWESVAEAMNGEPTLTTPVSTEFLFKLSLDEFPTASGCRFAVALVEKDKKKLIAEPLWASPASSSAQAELPKLTAFSADPSLVFSSGAAGVVAEIDLAKLIRPANDSNSRMCVWGDSIFYLSQSMLNSLTQKTDFYAACGMKYCFRLICTSDKFGVAADIAAAYYAIDVSEKQSYDTLAAVVSFLSEKYDPYGYILGRGLNTRLKNASRRFTDPFAVMKQTTDCVRLIYSISARTNPSTVVILPFEAFSKTPVVRNEGSARHLGAIPCAALADMYIAEGGSPIKWTALVSDPDNAATDIPSQAATSRGSGYLGTAINVSSGSASSLSEFKKEFPYALFYHVDLDSALSFESLRREAEASVLSLPCDNDFAGEFTLWDFSRSFSTGSWVNSNPKRLTTGVSPALSEISELISCRALYLDLGPAETQSAQSVAAALSPDGAPLSDCSAIEFQLAALSDDESASFTVHIGNGDGAWAFPVTVESEKAVSVTCGVPEGFVPTYFAISADPGDGVSVQLAKVAAHSKTLSAAELAEKAEQIAAEQESDERSGRELYLRIAAAIVAAVSLSVFIVMNRRIQNRKKEV